MNFAIKKLLQSVVNQCTCRKAIKNGDHSWFLSHVGRMLMVRHRRLNPDVPLVTYDRGETRTIDIKNDILHANSALGRPVQVSGDVSKLNLLDWAEMGAILTQYQFQSHIGKAQLPTYEELRPELPPDTRVPMFLAELFPAMWYALGSAGASVFAIIFSIICIMANVYGAFTGHHNMIALALLPAIPAIPFLRHVVGYHPIKVVHNIQEGVSASWDQVFELKTESDAILVGMLSGMYHYTASDSPVDYSQYTPKQAFNIISRVLTSNDSWSGGFSQNASDTLNTAIEAIKQREDRRKALDIKARACLQSTGHQKARTVKARKRVDHAIPHEIEDTYVPPDHISAYADDPYRSKIE